MTAHDSIDRHEQFPSQPAPDRNAAPEPTPMGDPGVLQPFVVAILVTALITGLVVIIRLSSPDLAWRWLPISVFLIALEAVYTSRWLAHPQRRQLNRGGYRLAELTVIALALRFLTWALSGGIPGWDVWRTYLLSPLSFFDGLFFGYLLCGIFAWERAITFSSQLRALAISYAEERFYTLPADVQRQRSFDRPVDPQRPDAFRSLVSSWLGGGLLLALSAAISTVDLGAVDFDGGLRSIVRLGLNNAMLIAMLVYFILGLWVISEARLEMMRARWLADGVKTRKDVVDNWRRSSITVLALFAVIAAFLPIGSTFAAAALLQAVFSAALVISQLFFLFFTTLLVALISLLGIGAPMQEGEEVLSVPSPSPPPAPSAAPLDETTALVAGGVFWLLVAVVALVALIFFLRDRGVSLRYEPLARFLKLVRRWLAQLRDGLAQQTAGARRVIRRRLQALRPLRDGSSAPWRFLRVNALPPREQIRYFYLSTLRRAADEGLPRDKSETPTEYAQDLQDQWPEAGEEIDALTAAFLEARYSRRRYQPQDVNPVKKVWKHVRRTIRRRLSP